MEEKKCKPNENEYNSSYLCQLFANNLLKDIDSCSSDTSFFDLIISHFSKIFINLDLHLVLFSVERTMNISVHSCSSHCNSDIVREIFESLDKDIIHYLFYSDASLAPLKIKNEALFFVSKIYSGFDEGIYAGIYGKNISGLDLSIFSDAMIIIKNKIYSHKRIMQLTNENRSLSFSVNLLRVINQISEFLINSMDENDIYSILLLGITAGQGLGFNRCFIFKLNPERNALIGERAIGPLDPFEAHTTWERVEKQFTSLRDILGSFRSTEILENRSNKLIKRISIPIANNEYNPFLDILQYTKPIFIQYIDPFYKFAKDFFDITGIGSFAAYPIKTLQEDFGILIVDNKFTEKYPSDDELQLLQTIIVQASAIIQNVRLYKKLTQKIDTLKAVQREIDINREKLYKAERYSIAGEILEKLAHTLKNPLVAIGGFARSLQKSNINSQKRKQYSEILLMEVQKIEKILDDVLNFSKETMPLFEPEDINIIVKDTIDILKEDIARENAEILLNLSNLLPNIPIDKNQITQVIINILRNAFYAARKKGVPPVISINSIKSGDFIVVSISDNGIGIPESNIDKLFNAFFSTKDIGTGLGLTICGQIIRNHKGHLTVKSEPGKGSTFNIHLPIEQ